MIIHGFDYPNLELRKADLNVFWNAIDFRISKSIEGEVDLYWIVGCYYIDPKRVHLYDPWREKDFPRLQEYLKELFERNLKLLSFQ